MKTAKKKAGLPIGAHRTSSAIGRSVVSYCALLHNTRTGQEQAARLEATKERAELLVSVKHTRVARPKGAYPVALARQVAEMWRQQGWKKQSEQRQEMVSKAGVMGQRELEVGRASWLAAGSLGPVEEELRMLELEVVIALEVLEAKGAAEAMEVARASGAVEEAGARAQEKVSKIVEELSREGVGSGGGREGGGGSLWLRGRTEVQLNVRRLGGLQSRWQKSRHWG